MTPVVLHRLAKEELRTHAFRYERERQGRGRRFLLAFEEVVQNLEVNPFLFAVEYRNGIRLAQLSRFSFALPYLIEEDRIWVAAVAHQKRRPKYWSKRLRNR